jgi:hypothetical protein
MNSQAMVTAKQWDFQWADQTAPEALAQVVGRLRWRGFELGFALDGLLGLDGRLATPSLATLPAHLQQLVLHHFAAECLKTLAMGPFSDLALVSLQWHEDPLPMEGEFGFTLRRRGVRGSSLGALTVFNDDGRVQLIRALASQGWPLPGVLANVVGQLQIGTVPLTPDELSGLEPGDLVWIDDAELSALGLRAQFSSHEDASACAALIKRSVMTRDALQSATLNHPSQVGTTGMTTLVVKSPLLSVARVWLTGAQPLQRLPQTALALTWQAQHNKQVVFEGQLIVIGRRLGLRVTQINQNAQTPQTPQALPPQHNQVN